MKLIRDSQNAWHIRETARLFGWIPGSSGELEVSLWLLIPESAFVLSALVVHAAHEYTYPPNWSVTSYGATRLVTAVTMFIDSVVSAVAMLQWGWKRSSAGLRDLLDTPEIRADAARRSFRVLILALIHGSVAIIAFPTFSRAADAAHSKLSAYLVVGSLVDDVLGSLQIEIFSALVNILHDRL
ncbi:uncharacterized protein LOC127749934 [Frankliniella occidentalis]|uniref:Uncharacterized protein LOC127749934 n=1 Tax=Frankliniella occidentalis TaxID=133901 RepID=A0A9C6UBY1_FRAOC|nr:uncharacterized protein LOC127749934 [Frankliniella occidentalis]XP_052126008.1 uncharacterized protein LOC127749934 [Frankliniella occidentalis]